MEYRRALLRGSQPVSQSYKMLTAWGSAERSTHICGQNQRPHDAQHRKAQHGYQPSFPHPHHLPPPGFRGGSIGGPTAFYVTASFFRDYTGQAAFCQIRAVCLTKWRQVRIIEHRRALLQRRLAHHINQRESLAAREPAGRLTRFCGKYQQRPDEKHQETRRGKKPFLPHPHHLPPAGNLLGVRWANRLLCNAASFWLPPRFLQSATFTLLS